MRMVSSRSPARGRKKTGFTLIEMVFVVIIVGIVAAIGSLTLINIIEGFVMAKEASEISQKGQLALSKVAVELDHVNATGISDGLFLSDDLTFTATFNNATENHQIYLDAGANSLMYDNSVLSDMVTGLDFQYFESDGVSTATVAANIRIIQVTVTLTGDLVPSRSFTTRVAPLPMWD